MKKIEYTKVGYSYVKVSPIENLQWGGLCICNGCDNTFIQNDMYLVFVLTDTYCEKCFKEWEKRSENYKKQEIEEDIALDREMAYKWYKCHLPNEDLEK